MKHLDLFSGLGGFAYGLSLAGGFKTIAFCEVNEYCQKLLKKNFGKDIKIYNDVRELEREECDLITAGFPCQDLSVAGSGVGLSGSRSGLFYETLRIANASRARFILYENSPQLIWRDSFREELVASLQKSGWCVFWRICSAKECGFYHKRERAFCLCVRENVAHADKLGRLCSSKIFTHFTNEKPRHASKTLISLYNGFMRRERSGYYELDYRDIRGDDGVSEKLERIHALGNAVVPQIVTKWGHVIRELNEELWT